MNRPSWSESTTFELTWMHGGFQCADVEGLGSLTSFDWSPIIVSRWGASIKSLHWASASDVSVNVCVPFIIKSTECLLFPSCLEWIPGELRPDAWLWVNLVLAVICLWYKTNTIHVNFSNSRCSGLGSCLVRIGKTVWGMRSSPWLMRCGVAPRYYTTAYFFCYDHAK